MYARLLAQKSETIQGGPFVRDKIRTTSTYAVERGKTLLDLEKEEKQIWSSAPRDWWKARG